MATVPRPRGDAALVAEAVHLSGLAARQFAVRIARVNERTVRRWLSGESEIRDRSQRERIERYVARERARASA